LLPSDTLKNIRSQDGKVPQMGVLQGVDHPDVQVEPFHIILHKAYKRMTQRECKLVEKNGKGSAELDRMEKELGFCGEKDEADLIALQVILEMLVV
jgi:hypothetical protein